MARAWAVSFVVLFALWLLVDDNDDWAELVAGAICAAVAATASVLVRSQRQTILRPRAGWLRALPRPAWRAIADLPAVAAVVWRRGVLRRDERGEVVEVPFTAVGHDPEAAAHRVLAQTLGSLAPATVVLGVDDERRVLLAHRLQRGDDPLLDADPLAAVDPRGATP